MDMDLAEQGGVEWIPKFCPVKGSIRHDLHLNHRLYFCP